MLLEELLLGPDKNQIEVIKTHLGEDSERFENNLGILEQWMTCQTHLPQNIERNMLATYLRGCKNDMEKTKRKIELYFVCKTKMPELLSVREFKEEEIPFIKNTIVFPLPKLTPEGIRLSIFSIRDSKIELFNYNLAFLLVWKLGQLRLCKEKMTSGEIFIVDLARVRPQHVSKIDFVTLKKAAFVAQEAFCNRIKGMYFVNSPGFFEKTIGAMKVFAKPKLRERVKVDQGFSSLLKDLPRECLPEDYGGLELPVNRLMDKWFECLEENKEWFENWETLKVKGKIPKSVEDEYDFDGLQGIQGSFRQLNLD